MDVLDTFKLRDKEQYRRWWDERRATNDNVWQTHRYEYIMGWLPKTPSTILEVGCQTGGFTIPMLQAGHKVTAVDVVSENLDIVRGKAVGAQIDDHLETELSFVEDLTHESAFDIVLLCEVLIHCLDDEEAVRRVVRAARDGGRIILTVPSAHLYEGVEISRHYDTEDWDSFVKRCLGQLNVKDWRIMLLLYEHPVLKKPHTYTAEIVK